MIMPALRARTILCLGAHSDDIEIGCGGTLLHLLSATPAPRVYWVVFSGDARRAAEARAAAQRIVGSAQAEVVIETFPDGRFPGRIDALKTRFEALKREFSPELIFTHFRHDRHQDHRIISELTWNTFRDHLILEYEVPKYDGDIGRPNLHVPLSDDAVSCKIEVLMDCFASQHDHRWFDAATFGGLMRLRGVECNADSGYAEAFHAYKLVMCAAGDEHGS